MLVEEGARAFTPADTVVVAPTATPVGTPRRAGVRVGAQPLSVAATQAVPRVVLGRGGLPSREKHRSDHAKARRAGKQRRRSKRGPEPFVIRFCLALLETRS